MSVEERVWTERHRPSTLDDVVGHDEITDRMQQWVNDNSCPNLLLSGPPGVGKTASVVAFAKEKFGDSWTNNLIEMNASDERGIDVVRDQIKKVAREQPSAGHSFKIIFLDEVDHLTKDAQAALRRTMEKYSDQTRFFLSCNFPNKLIQPIQSRCTVLPFTPLSDDEIQTVLTRILEAEEVEYEDSAVQKIIEYVDGDARRAVQTLQTSVEDGSLTEELLDVVGNQVDTDVVDGLLYDAHRGNLDDVHDAVVKEVVPNVIDYSKFANTVMRSIRENDDIPRDVRFYLMSRVGQMEKNVLEGASPNVQLTSFFAEVPVVRHSSIPNYSDE